jgi:hypothetical protein
MKVFVFFASVFGFSTLGLSDQNNVAIVEATKVLLDASIDLSAIGDVDSVCSNERPGLRSEEDKCTVTFTLGYEHITCENGRELSIASGKQVVLTMSTAEISDWKDQMECPAAR